MESERKEWYYEQCKEDRSNKIFYSYACRYAVMKLSTYKKMILDISYKNVSMFQFILEA